jgi:ATP-dependent helicase HrpA
MTSEAEQREANHRGYPRLALLMLGQTGRYLRKQAERERELGLHYAPLGSAGQLQDELLRGSVWYCFFEGQALPRTAPELQRRLLERKGELTATFERTLAALRETLVRRFRIGKLIGELESPAYRSTLADAAAQLDRLVPAHVLSITPSAQLAELPRYLDALEYRLTHLQGKVRKDQELMAVVDGFQVRLDRLVGTAGLDEAARQRLRFGLEELRIGLFAEPLGTRGKTSPKRLDREFVEVERELGLV